MADLMNDKSVTFQSLVQKYGNFMVPVVKIKLQGTELISALNLAVENVSIVHSLDSAGSCNFSIVNAYDLKTRQFKSKILSKLKLGSILQVEIGYASALTLVFKGYISEMSYDFSEHPTLEVTAMDMRKLMMEARDRMTSYKAKTYSEAFSELMGAYKKICTTLVIDKTTDQLGEDGVAQKASDYKFVKKELARKGNREFFILAGKAYFRIPKKTKQPITTLTWGSNLISFNRTSSYTMAAVKVIGFDEDKSRSFVGEATVKSSDPQISVLTKAQPIVITDPDATDQSKAKQRAQVEAERMQQESESASGACIGLPEIVPGRFIKIEKLGAGMDKKYYITRVQHSLGNDGFTTSFNVGGWE